MSYKPDKYDESEEDMYVTINSELNDAPIMMNHSESIPNSAFVELHEKLASIAGEFFKKYGNPKSLKTGERGWNLVFSIDDLDSLAEYGKWTPCNDSCLSIDDKKRESIIMSM